MRQFLAMPIGIPSHDRFSRFFARLNLRKFGVCVAGWTGAACEATGLRHIAIDGKAVRATPRDTFSGCLLLVNGWEAENQMIVGLEPVADGSHEMAAIPELLKVLALKGALD